MTLSIQQKSIYLILFNATMVMRSIGKRIKNKEKQLEFKKALFEEIEKLTRFMDKGKLVEMNILHSITILSKKFNISFGQAQKPINVILKYHFFLTENQNTGIKSALHCPLDSVVLKELKKYYKDLNLLSLESMNQEAYVDLQEKIKSQTPTRIEFDIKWDKQHLEKVGLWYQ